MACFVPFADPTMIITTGMSKSPLLPPGLRVISPSDLSQNEECEIYDPIPTIDIASKSLLGDGGRSHTDSFSESINGDDTNLLKRNSEETFSIGGLNVKNSVFDDLLNERKLELLNDPEVMSLLATVMQQSQNKKE